MPQLVDIECTVRQVREKSLAIADGTTETLTDPGTGQSREREKWFFLPLSLIEVEPADYQAGSAVVVTLPQWKAKEIGLI